MFYRLRTKLGLSMPAAVCLTAALVIPGVAGAQSPLEVHEKRDLDELPERAQRWVTAEVGHIITDEEYDVFLRLVSEEQFDTFIRRFWEVRDPTPGTPKNEYYELHYERLAYVDKFFGRGTSLEGWQTDRGRIWILLGEPLSRNRIPSDMLVYPVEIWMYSPEPEFGISDFFYMTFYQRYGNGDYRLYSPLVDGPEKLLNGAGVHEISNRQQNTRAFDTYAPTGFGDVTVLYSIFREIDNDLAVAAFTNFPSEAGMQYGVTPLRSEMLIGLVAAAPEAIMPNADWAYRVLTGSTESEVRYETLEMQATAIGLLDIDGQPFIHFGTITRGQNLNMVEYDDNFFFSFEASGSLTTPEAKVLRNFEAQMSGELEPEQARRFNSQLFAYLDLLPALPGRQNFTVVLENSVARTFGQQTLEVDVPRAHPERLTLVGPVAVMAAQQLPQYDPYASRYAFQYGDLLMVPAIDGKVQIGQPLMAFQQVLLPAGHTAAVTGRYELRSASGIVVQEGSEDFTPAQANEHGVIPHVWNLETGALTPGDYTLEIRLDGDGQIGLRADIEVLEPDERIAQPFINAQTAPPATDVGVAIDRATQYLARGEPEPAVEIMREALRRDPDNEVARDVHVSLLEAAGNWEELIEILTSVVVDNPRDADNMLKLARAHAQAGQHYDAIRYYERSRIVRGEDSPKLLNALATEYSAEGRPDKAKELLERSLELDSAQPEIRQMLERISQPTAEPSQ